MTAGYHAVMENATVTAIEFRRIFGENIRNRRAELDLTQRDVAGALGCSQAKIAQIESGVRPLPSDELAVLAEALRTTPAALVTPGNFSPVPA